jgi:hypothetical protein
MTAAAQLVVEADEALAALGTSLLNARRSADHGISQSTAPASIAAILNGVAMNGTDRGCRLLPPLEHGASCLVHGDAELRWRP